MTDQLDAFKKMVKDGCDNVADDNNDRNFDSNGCRETAAEVGLNWFRYMNWNISFLIIDI